jgi:adenosylcobinamide-phosphate guanylyltransferase
VTLEALINAGGKGTRMGHCGVEKPMQLVGGIPTVERVVNALSESKHIDRVLVSVSDNTMETEAYLESIGVETVRTSGESFMDDLHESFRILQGEYVLTCPSDLPLLRTDIVDGFIEFFEPGRMESAIAVIDEDTVRKVGITPSYTREHNGRNWVLSGICIMNRAWTLEGRYLEEFLYETSSEELAVNVNTKGELALAKLMAEDLSRIP